MGAERDRVAGFGRLEDGLRQASDWYLWGPYVSERQWGRVREDYGADSGAWDYLPHDAARSRAYRWGEDGMAGFCDVEQQSWTAAVNVGLRALISSLGHAVGCSRRGRRLVVKARREPVKELLVLAGPGDLAPHRLAEPCSYLSHCPNS